MTDLSTLLTHAADDLSRHVTPPPTASVLARGRRLHRLRVTLPALLVPTVAAALVVLVAAGPALVLPGQQDSRRTAYASDGPELGHIPLPSNVPAAHAPGAPVDPPSSESADLLAVATTRSGQARLIGYQLRSGAHCVLQDYAVPFLNSTGGTTCVSSAEVPYNREPLTVGGSADATPGSIKSAPLAYGGAPAGTRTVEFTAPDQATVRAAARDGGPAYSHRAFFITSWPFGIRTTVRALDAEGRELARTYVRGQGPEAAAQQCESAAGILLSHLQRATLVGEKWARTHPKSADAERLRFPTGRPAGPGQATVDSATATARFRVALRDVKVLGPEETYEYRLAAVVVLGDGKTCFDQPLADAATQLRALTSGSHG